MACSYEGDWFIIELALLLYDVGDGKVIRQDDDDYSIAESFLESQSVSPYFPWYGALYEIRNKLRSGII